MIRLAVLLFASVLAFAQADWRTPAEISNYRTTPRYDETMAYVRRVAAAAPKQVKVISFGKTGEGRDLVAVIVSRDGVFEPAALHRANRPIVLIQNAIHAGEMDGKDSCLALLRDLVISKTQVRLLERTVVMIIPIYNADGHERFGPYNRINQNGPEQMGWRTQALNLNLNRDYLKAEAIETRAFLRLWNEWLPDFFVDDHVTDGADYQYDITYLLEDNPNQFPPLADWQHDVLAPYMKQSVEKAGHLMSPYIFLEDDTDPSKGMTGGVGHPRFSTSYVLLQNRPALLVEMHMLKDYRTRVTGNYEVLRVLLEVINRDANSLLKMNRDTDAAQIAAGKTYRADAQFPLSLEPTGTTAPFDYKGYKFTRSLSEVSSTMRIEYTHEPLNITISRQIEMRIMRAVAPPLAYIVPAQWAPVIEVLKAHGLKLLRTTRDWEAEVETYRCEQPKWQEVPFEGHHMVSWPKSQAPCKTVREKLAFPAGSTVVPLDQRAAKVAIHWLEPEAPDSAMAWGLFDTIFEQKEFAEAYVVEKLARDMMARDPKLKQEFEQRVASDREFAASPQARLNFFYKRSPWWDNTIGLYPVGRLTSLEEVPLR